MKSKYYTPDEIYEILEQAQTTYQAWTMAPARRVAKEMYLLGELLGVVDKPKRSNGNKQAVTQGVAPWECDT